MKNEQAKIAVFTLSEADFRELELRPKEVFRRITRMDHIRGVRFDGVIRGYEFYHNKQYGEIHDILIKRQPELT